MKTRWLDRTLIRGPSVTLCKSEEQYNKVMRDLGVDYPDPWIGEQQMATVHHFSNAVSGGRSCVVCIGNMKNVPPIRIASILVHEAVHIWQTYIEFIDEENPSKEFEAYSIEAISYNLMEEYVRC